MRFARALEAALVASLLTAGCSGGDDKGGGNSGGEPPIADAGDDAAARIHQVRTLNGSQSEDPEGKDLTFAWSVLSAPDGSAATLTSGGAAAIVSFTPDAEGVYLFGLVVSDGKKTSAIDTVEITVTLQVAVFGDLSGHLAQELELSGAGDVDDHFGFPDSVVVGASDGVVLLRDHRYRYPSLIAYYTFNGAQEYLAGGDIDDARIDGGWVVWTETRAGQSDIFARELVTGNELQLTSSPQLETLGNLAAGFVTWEEIRDPTYGIDVFAYDLDVRAEIEVSPAIPGVDEVAPHTDGATIVYTADPTSPDAFAFSIAGQSRVQIATVSTNLVFALGVEGDFVVLSIDTGGNSEIVRQKISDGSRASISTGGSVLEISGDYAIFTDVAGLHAYRFSTATVIDVSTAWVDTDLSDGVVTWTEFNPTTSSDDVYSKVLPAGAVTQITDTTVDEASPVYLGSGIAWHAVSVTGVIEGYHSPDGGGTVELASIGKIPLSDVVGDYDVAIVSHHAGPVFTAAIVDALSSGGVPILSFERDGGSVGQHYVDEGLYDLSIDDAPCGPAVVNITDAVASFEGFLPGAYWELERFITGADYEARSFDVLGGPADWTAHATHGANPNTCVLGGETVIASFTNADGTRVILDGVATDSLEFWEPSRRALTLAELRYLAATLAP